ncbi:MAG: PAAR domain-containing protein [Myxococcota bacterium]
MKPAGRVGDIAFCPSDSHGCPGCAHPVQGPAIQGSPNVLINDLPALRVGDPGIHAACCGGNQWKAKEGARSVLINDKPLHRQGDASSHCGGNGKLMVGSNDVVVGELTQAGQTEYDQMFIIYFADSNEPVSNVSYRIKMEMGQIVEGKTDFKGQTKLLQSRLPEMASIELFIKGE